MKGRVRSLWMKVHTYLACFFIPFLILYVITGLLYFLGIEGESAEEVEVIIPIEASWPDNEKAAKDIVEPYVIKHKRLPFPPDYYIDKGHEWHSWYGYKQEILLLKTEDTNTVRLLLIQHDFLQQLMLIHKGHAGIFLLILGIMLGLSLLTTMISGVVLALTIPTLKKTSGLMILLGCVSLVLAYFIGY